MTESDTKEIVPIIKLVPLVINVDRRNLFFLLFGIALIFSVVSMNWVAVENALSAYLPETTETSQGLDRNFTIPSLSYKLTLCPIV